MGTEKKILVNQLQLACSPVSNYDFAHLRKSDYYQNVLEQSSLYVIAGRPALSFANITVGNKGLLFEICQDSTSDILKCELPLCQDKLFSEEDDPIINFGTHNSDINLLDIKDIHGITFSKHEHTEPFLYVTPERLLHFIWHNYLTVNIIAGDYRNFTRYAVHYVGKATDQKIWNRISRHEKLQDILSKENALSYGTLPTHEIALLFFKLADKMQIQVFDQDSDFDTISLFGEGMPTSNKIFLDAEKVLINAMQPKYNIELFKTYPNKNDVPLRYSYDTVGYTFVDPISLVYDNGAIHGALGYMKGDVIRVHNKQVTLHPAID